MHLQVNQQQRRAKMRAHTATHLLHNCLDNLLEWTKQSGSVVDEDLVRFDFAARQPLTDEQLLSLEKEINDLIREWVPLVVKETNLDDAKKLWAKAFFEDKYGDIVRVVRVGDSIELCWWTHVSNTADIWAFKIIAQEAVASWIRRIVAVTGTQVAQYFMKQEQEISALASTIGTTPKQLPEKLSKTQKELTDTQSAYESLKTKQLWSSFATLPQSDHEQFDYLVHIEKSALKDYAFKDVVATARQSLSDKNRLFFTTEWAFALYIAQPTESLSAKQFLKDNGIRWWWSDQLAQGKDPALVALFA